MIRLAERLRLRDERGDTLVFVAIGLPVVLAVFAIVLDVGNWFVHKRALQNEVDASVLAGSQLWGSCFKGLQSPQAMYDEADRYGGLAGYNPQIGGSLKGQLSVLYNSAVYPPDAPSGAGPDDTPPDPCTPVTLSDGQAHYLFDVKATEKDVPLILGGLLPGVAGPDIHATARTDLRQVESLSGMLPIGVLDPSPKWLLAQFVDENASDAPLTSWIPLCKGGTAGCPVGSGSGQQLWTTPATTPVSIASRNVGVRLKFVWGGSDQNAACGTTLVDCYDNVPSQAQSDGLVHIRGYDPAAAVPAARNVWLLPGGCSDGYFAASSCDAGVQAEVDLGETHPLGGSNGQSAEVWASVDGSGTYQLSPPATPPATGLATWTLAGGLPLTTSGPHAVALAWSWKQTSGTWNGKTCTASASKNPCTDGGTFGAVQRAFVADGTVRSGPVQQLTVWSSSVTGGANSFPLGSTQNLGVTVGNPCFDTQVNDPNCPLVYLRVSTSVTGSQSQSLDCDPAISNFRDEVAQGCSPGYTPFPKDSSETACPTQSALWSTANPPGVWDCVAVETGNMAGQVSQGLGERIGTDPGTCSNGWPDYPANDRRQVPLFLVPWSAFGDSGSNATYPVLGFGAFYITGYNGDPCPGATPNVPKGTVAGYFITYLADDPRAKPSSKPCDPSSLTPCIPLLVK